MQQTGNIQQFRPEAHRSYLRMLARLCLPRRLNRRLDASDIVQATQVKAFEKAEQFRGENTVQYKAWLRQILRNTLRDTLRKQLAAPEESIRACERSFDGLEARLVDSAPEPGAQVELQEDLERMADLLAGLPDDQQEVLIMKHCLDWKVADIAAELDRTKQSVAGLLRRGLQQLRDKLAKEER